MPPKALTDTNAQGDNVIALDPAKLIAKAIEHGVPVEALERLLAMRATLVEESARSAFFQSLADFQSGIPVIPKRQSASTGKFSYHYANLADIQQAIAPLLSRLGLSVTFDTCLNERMLTVIARVHHSAGHSESTTFAVPLDNSSRMSPAQAMGSALTYARRYALCAALGIVTAEDDDDGVGTGVSRPSSVAQPQHNPAIEHITQSQHRRLEARINELGLDRIRVKQWVSRAWGVDHLTEVPASKYSDLDKRLEVWASQQFNSAAERQAEREAIIERQIERDALQ